MDVFIRKRLLIAGVIVATTLLLTVAGRQIIRDPNIPLLISEGGAEWIRFREPFRLPIHWSKETTTRFRYRLELERIPVRMILTVRAMKQAAVSVDGSLLFASPDDPSRWKEAWEIDLAPLLNAGRHEIRIDVVNASGHPSLLAYCDALDIRTGENWEASEDGEIWQAALPVDEIPPFPLSLAFPRADRALRDLLPLYVPIFALVFFWSLRPDFGSSPLWVGKSRLSAGAVRWLLLGAWLLMAFNNFWKLPIEMGMDYRGHIDYIRSVADHWRIPLATEGWQMFQPPLFYYLEAILYQASLLLVGPETAVRILKLLPVLCGAAQVEICYRTLRYAYPEKESLQIIGTLLGGLLPMNLYMSQSLGNEPLAGFLVALIVMFTCRICRDDSPCRETTTVFMGFVLGLALLSKNTAVLIVGPAVFFISLRLRGSGWSRGEGTRRMIRFVSLFLGISLSVSGWYYLRNYIEMGTIFIKGSYFISGANTFREAVWWQDPGYRTVEQCYRLVEALFYPIYSSIHGFGNAVYSSLWLDGYLSSFYDAPWNYPFMLSGAWLALPPTAAIFIGGFVAVTHTEGPERLMLRFSVCSVLIYLAAIFYIFLTVPILSSAKATYALGLIPCFALLGAAGFGVVTRWRFLRAVIYGLFACWAVGAYASYFVI